jgi:tetratricopeptide (TPR) repeat protein
MTRLPLNLALIFTLAVLATPATAATRPAPAKPASAKPALVPATVSAEDLMRQAQDASAKGDKDLALRLAQAAIVADPAKPQTYDLLGDLYAAEGQGDFAGFYYGEALSIDPSDPAAAKGTAGLARGNDQRAAEATPPAQ